MFHSKGTNRLSFKNRGILAYLFFPYGSSKFFNDVVIYLIVGQRKESNLEITFVVSKKLATFVRQDCIDDNIICTVI